MYSCQQVVARNLALGRRFPTCDCINSQKNLPFSALVWQSRENTAIFSRKKGNTLPLQHSFYQNLKEGKAVRAAIPLIGIEEKERLHCFYGKAEPPAFTLTFPFGTLAVDQVDTTRTCVVVMDFADTTVSLSADISRIIDEQTLEVITQDSVVHAQSRSYFRVDAQAKVAATPIAPEAPTAEEASWCLLGDTIDISGSGLLCSFTEPIDKDKRVRVDLTLPIRDLAVIGILGHVVRCRKVEEHCYHVAVHFDFIDSESQDTIMACCFELQRRNLRMRVQVRN